MLANQTSRANGSPFASAGGSSSIAHKQIYVHDAPVLSGSAIEDEERSIQQGLRPWRGSAEYHSSRGLCALDDEQNLRQQQAPGGHPGLTGRGTSRRGAWAVAGGLHGRLEAPPQSVLRVRAAALPCATWLRIARCRMHADTPPRCLCPLQEAQQGGSTQPQQFSVSMSVPNVTMAKGGGGGGKDFGSGSSLSMVMERSKLEFVMPTPPQQAPKLDDGGSGGDDGKHNHHGGGGGDGDGGDDDDYFGGEGDGEGDGQGGGGGGGDGFFRTALPELYDRLTIGAVLQEWYKTVAELPLFIRRAVEMGLFSSAQLVRFLSMDVRPNVARAVSRTLPAEVRGRGLGQLGVLGCCMHSSL